MKKLGYIYIMKIKLVIVLGLLSLFVAGCQSPYGLERSGENGVNGADVGNTYSNGGPYAQPSSNYSGASTGDFYQDPLYGVNVVGGPESNDRDRVIYFSYDSAAIDERSENVIREHAKYLRNHPQTMVVLEGHTDERGTREYNIGLGERRAYSVKQHFTAAGVDKQQMRVLSYGEERPAVWGSDEISYAKNRRVVIIY